MAGSENLTPEYVEHAEEVRELCDWQLGYFGADYKEDGALLVTDRQMDALVREAQADETHPYVPTQMDQVTATKIRRDAEHLVGNAVLHGLRQSVTPKQSMALPEVDESGEQPARLAASFRDYQDTRLEGYTRLTATRAWGNLRRGFSMYRHSGESHWLGKAFADSGVVMYVDESHGSFVPRDEDYSVDIHSLKAAVDSGKITEIYDLGKLQAGVLGLFATKMIAKAEEAS